MAGNAHRNRPRSSPCKDGCLFCKYRPAEAKARHAYRNHNGHRRNTSRKRRGRRAKVVVVVQ